MVVLGGSIFSLLQNIEALSEFNVNFSIVSLYEIPILTKLIKDNDIKYYYKIPFTDLKTKNKKTTKIVISGLILKTYRHIKISVIGLTYRHIKISVEYCKSFEILQ